MLLCFYAFVCDRRQQFRLQFTVEESSSTPPFVKMVFFVSFVVSFFIFVLFVYFNSCSSVSRSANSKDAIVSNGWDSPNEEIVCVCVCECPRCGDYSLSSLSFLCDFFLSRDFRLDSRLFDRRRRSERSLLRERSL